MRIITWCALTVSTTLAIAALAALVTSLATLLIATLTITATLVAAFATRTIAALTGLIAFARLVTFATLITADTTFAIQARTLNARTLATTPCRTIDTIVSIRILILASVVRTVALSASLLMVGKLFFPTLVFCNHNGCLMKM